MQASLDVSLSKSLKDLKEQVGKKGVTKGKKHVRMSNSMIAHLGSDSGLKVERLDAENEKETLSSSGTADWNWNVEAVKPGKHKLTATLSALIYVNDEERWYEVKTYGSTIAVHVTPFQRVIEFGNSNFAALLISVATLLLGSSGVLVWIRRRNERRLPRRNERRRFRRRAD